MDRGAHCLLLVTFHILRGRKPTKPVSWDNAERGGDWALVTGGLGPVKKVKIHNAKIKTGK